jgi:hypothetical protein
MALVDSQKALVLKAKVTISGVGGGTCGNKLEKNRVGPGGGALGG